MNPSPIISAFIRELQAEKKATRKCLERITPETFKFKPHPKSMEMGVLAELVAEIPLWITHMIKEGEIDFVTFNHIHPKTTGELVQYFDDNIKNAEEALENSTEEMLDEMFSLKANGKLMYQSPKRKDIETTLNHWVHHRGQLTVYMRLNDIPVPSIYGPSADDRSFAS